jgi:NYN domain
MGSTALLIDWDNLRTRQGAEFGCHDLGPSLFSAAADWAAARGSGLDRATAFAPKGCWDATLRNRLEQAGIKVEDTPAYRQGADLRIFITAIDLHLREHFDGFVLVSGDEGFLALARELEARDCQCAIWAFSEAGLTQELASYGGLRFIKGMFELDPCPPLRQDETHLLVLALEALALKGLGCWYAGRTRTEIARLGIGGLTQFDEITRVWETAEQVGYFARDEPRPDQCSPNATQRLRVELPELRRLLAASDELLIETAKQTDIQRGAPVPKRLLFDSYRHPWAYDPQAPFDLLVASGMLAVDTVDGVALADPRLALGILGAMHRLAAAAWTLLAAPHPTDGPVLSIGRLAPAWVRHISKGRRLGPTDFQALVGQGKQLVRMAIAHNLFYKPSIGVGLAMREDHPFAQAALAGMEAIVRLLDSYPQKAIPSRQLLLDMADLSRDDTGWPVLGQTANENESWLGLMAAERHIRQIKPASAAQRVVTLLGTPFVERC